jgi:hypothetical protein
VGVKLTIFLIIPLRRRLKAAEEALACLPQRFEPEPGFDSGWDDCRGQKAWAARAAEAPVVLFCELIPRVILLVFLLVSAAIDGQNDIKFRWLRE